MLMPGRNEILHDALVAVSPLPDNHGLWDAPVPVDQLPPTLLRYTLPSRYCDSDKLLDFAWQHFGHINNGLDRVQAICDWVHNNIEYRFLSGRPDLSASEVIGRRYGVCRDFAHVAIALCRAFNLPVRYVTGHLPDIGYVDPGSPMDFHAYCEVYLGRNWYTFDARYTSRASAASRSPTVWMPWTALSPRSMARRGSPISRSGPIRSIRSRFRLAIRLI